MPSGAMFTRLDRFAFHVAQRAPRWMRYWIIVTEALQTHVEHPEQQLKSITWIQMVDRIRATRINGEVED